MRKIRRGIDIQMRWQITTDGEPVPLKGRDLTLEISDPFGLKKVLPFTSEGNTAIFKYLGIEQKRLGIYSLTMWENRGKEGQNAVDKVAAFMLVLTTAEMGTIKPEESALETVTVELGTSNFSIGGGGGYIPYDDTELWAAVHQMQVQITELQNRVAQLEQGGVTPPPPVEQITDAVMLCNGQPLMLCNGNYLKLTTTLN